MKCFIPNKFNFTIDYSKHDFQDVHETLRNISKNVYVSWSYVSCISNNWKPQWPNKYLLMVLSYGKHKNPEEL